MRDEIPDEPPNPDKGLKLEMSGGTPHHYATLEPMTEENPMKAVYKGTCDVLKLLLPTKHRSTMKLYLAASLLASINGWDWDDLKAMVESENKEPFTIADDWSMDGDS